MIDIAYSILLNIKRGFIKVYYLILNSQSETADSRRETDKQQCGISIQQ